jgi:quinohemoprotein amine dehydrogenase alpha subunit
MRPLIRLLSVVIPLGMLCLAATAFGETPFTKESVVSQRCSTCHKPDPQGQLEVIEETRKTPEEWRVVVNRMIRLNSAPLSDADFEPVIKELSRHLGLTPAEMAKVAYLNSDENSQYREIPQGELEERIFAACVRCHTYGKIASHRMTPAQWKENRNLHLGYYPTTIPQMREMDWAKESEELIEPLAKLFPFDTPEYQEWMKSRKDIDLSGSWQVAGYQPGFGYYEGEYVFKPQPAGGGDEYLVEKTVRYQNGSQLKMAGTAILYGTFHLHYALAPTPLTGRIEGVFDLDPAEGGFSGKWWTLVQDNNAYGNEKFHRSDAAARIFAAFPQALQIEEGDQTLTLIGVNLPQNITVADLQFSDPAVTAKHVEGTASKIVCQLQVGAAAATGTVTVKVGETAYADSLILFDKIEGIKVFPSLGRARVSCGAAYPPQGVQFVARGVHFGADGQAGTADDLMLEPVAAEWALEEEKTRENDDDLKYLQTSVVNGLFTPVTTYGPIEERVQHREGVGLIAISASATIDGRVLTDRALLAVTEPDFITHLK